MKQVLSLILASCFLLLGTGSAEYLHNLQHADEDAAAVHIAENCKANRGAEPRAGGDSAACAPNHSGDLPQGHHDESNCDFHRQLHLPIASIAAVPLLILLGIFVAFVSSLAPAPVARRVPCRLVCRGPPRV